MRRLDMQKWIGYTVVTLIFFFAGFSFNQSGGGRKNQSAEIEKQDNCGDAAVETQEKTGIGPEPGTADVVLHKPDFFSSVSDESYKGICDEVRNEIFPEMFARLSSVNPLEAVHLLETTDIKDAKLLDVLYKNLSYSWSQHDPDAAYKWMMSLRNRIPEETFNHSVSTILRQLAKTDPQTAASALKHISDQELLETTLPRVATQWAQMDPVSAFRWLETLQASRNISNDALRYSYSEMMSAYIQIDPQAAASIITRLESNSLQDRLLYNVAGEWAVRDLDAALQWAGSLNDDEAKTQGFAAIVKSQVYEQPAVIVNALLDHPDLRSEDQNLLSSAFESLAEKDAGRAYEILMQQPDEVQEQLAMPFAYGLGFQGKDFLADFIHSQPPVHMQDAALRAMVEINIEEDPVSSFNWLSKMNDVEKRDRLMREVARIAPADRLPEIEEQIQQLDISADQCLILDELISSRIKEEYSQLIIPNA